MTPMYTVVAIAYFVIALALIIVIMAQEKKSAGLGGGMSGMGASPQTYWDKNKGRSLEGKLHNYTKILGALFIILSLVLTIL